MKYYHREFFENNEEKSFFAAELARIPLINEIILFYTEEYGVLSFQVKAVRHLFQQACSLNVGYNLHERDLSYEFLVSRITNQTLKPS